MLYPVYSGGSGSPDRREVVKNPDGSTTTTVTRPDGTVIETTEYPGGTAVETTTDPEGRSSSKVSAPSNEPVKVTIPVKNAAPGLVPVLVNPDGSGELVRSSVTNEKGVTLLAKNGDVIKLKDGSRDFTDVKETDWFKPYVDFAVSRQLFAGISADAFGPRRYMTRAMLVQVLNNLEGNPRAASGAGFTDVKEAMWYAGAIDWAAGKKIVSGYGSGLFGPDDLITREQLAVMLWNYAGKPAVKNTELNFADAGSVSGYALPAVSWAVENGVMSGDGTNLAPLGFAARAEAAAMLYNFMNNILF